MQQVLHLNCETFWPVIESIFEHYIPHGSYLDAYNNFGASTTLSRDVEEKDSVYSLILVKTTAPFHAALSFT